MLYPLSSALLDADSSLGGFGIAWLTHSTTENCSRFPELDEAPFLPISLILGLLLNLHIDLYLSGCRHHLHHACEFPV